MVYKAAVIGCGKIGSQNADDPKIRDIYSHAEAYDFCRDTELAAFCDTDTGRLSQCGRRWEVTALYTRIDDLLFHEHPDIVSVCTPDETHFKIIRTILTAPGIRAIFSEKPLALTPKQAGEIVRLARKQEVILAVNYSRRYAGNHQKIREVILAGMMGEIRSVSGYYTRGLLHNGTHWLDLARFFLGDIEAVRGFDRLRERTDDPTLDAMIEFRNGASGYLSGCDAAAYSIFEMDIVGSLGRARLIDSGHSVECYKVGESPFYSGYRTLLGDGIRRGGMEDMLLHAVEDIVLCLNGKRTSPLCSGEDGVEAIRAAFAIQKSARTGKRVVL